MALAGCTSTAAPAPAPTTVKTTTVRVYGTIERPGGLLTPRVGGATCNSAMDDDIRATVLWSITAGTEYLGGGRLGAGTVRGDVNPYGSPTDGPCSFTFDDTVDMPPGGDVVLDFGNGAFPVNRLDLLAGPITIRTSVSGRLYRGIPGTEGIPVVPPSTPPVTTGSY